MMQIYALIETSKWYQGGGGVQELQQVRQKKFRICPYSLLLSFEKIGTPSGYISQIVLNYYSCNECNIRSQEVSSEKKLFRHRIRLF